MLGGRPPPPMGRGRIRRLSTRWLRVCLTFGSGATGREKGNLKFEKRERLSMWAVRQPLPGQRAALESRLRRDPGLRTTPGAPFLIPPLGYRFKKTIAGKSPAESAEQKHVQKRNYKWHLCLFMPPGRRIFARPQLRGGAPVEKGTTPSDTRFQTNCSPERPRVTPHKRLDVQGHARPQRPMRSKLF